MRRKIPQGFTLLELLTAIAMSGLLLLFGMPAWQGFVASQQHAVAVNTLLAALRHTRSAAVKNGTRTTLCVRRSEAAFCSATNSWSAGWIIFTDRNNNGRREADETLLAQQQPLAAAVSAQGNRFVASYISYTPLGLTRRAAGERTRGSLQMGTITICSGGGTQGHQLVINRAGRVDKRPLKKC